MPNGCVIKYPNPVTGMNQTSVLAYTLSQMGYSTEESINLVKRGSTYSKKDGYNAWPKPINRPEARFGNFIEIDSDNLVANLGLTSVLKPSQVSYMRAAQDLFEDVQVRVDAPINLKLLMELGNYVKKGGEASLKIEIVNPEAPLLQRMYKVYPVPATPLNREYLFSFIETEIFSKNVSIGKETRLDFLKPYIDFSEPDIYDTMAKMLNDPQTPAHEKYLIKKLLPMMDLVPTITFDFFTGSDILQVEKIPAGQYNREFNNIKLNVFGLKNGDMASARRLILHEVLHSVLSSAIDNPISEIDKKLVNSLKPVLAYYRQKYSSEKFTNEYYGLQDLHEFVSEFFTNPEFRDLLESNDSNWFLKTIDAIWKFFTGKLLLNKNVNSVENIEQILEDIFNDILYAQEINTSLTYTSTSKFESPLSFNQMLEIDKFTENNSELLSEFSANLDRLLAEDNLLNWSKIMDQAEFLGVNVNSVLRTKDTFVEISPAEAKESFKSMVTFFHETAKYLRSIRNSLDKLAADPNITADQVFRQAYHAKELGEQYINFVEKYREVMGNIGIDTILGTQLLNIKSTADSLKEAYLNNATEALAIKLADEFAPQTKDAQKRIQENIERFKVSLASAQSLGNAKLIKLTEDRIKNEEARLQSLATKSNIITALKGQIKDIGNFSLFLESAGLSGNVITGTVGGMIANQFDSANVKAQSMEVKLKRLADELQNHLKSKGVGVNTSFDFENVFGRFLKKTEVVEMKNGKIAKRDTLVLLSEMDEVRYNNDLIKLKQELRDLKQTKVQDSAVKDLIKAKEAQIRNFKQQYEEQPYQEVYYQIQNMLSSEAREARDLILQEMDKIQVGSLNEENSEEQLDKLEDLKEDLDRLESDYDKNKNLKDEEGLRIAANIREWKRSRTAAQLYTYNITKENQELFDSQLIAKKTAYDKAVSDYEQSLSEKADPETLDYKKQTAEYYRKQFELWKANNCVRKISPEFYKNRKQITDSIAAIQGRYPLPDGVRKMDVVWGELFDVLKGYKNSDNFYEGSKISSPNEDGTPSNISAIVRSLEEEIEDIKTVYKKENKMSKEDQDALTGLFANFSDIQEKVYTPDYIKEYTSRLNAVKTSLIAKDSTRYQDQSDDSLLKLDAEKELRKTEWYKQNHKKVSVWDSVNSIWTNTDEPLYFWTATEPTDKTLISDTSPSFRWNTIAVNPIYVRPEIKNVRYSKRVPLRTDKTDYRNKEYDRLDAKEKEILKKVTDIYLELQSGTPMNLKKGLELPSVVMDSTERSLKGTNLGTLKSKISSTAQSIWDKATFEDDEEVQRDTAGTVMQKVNKRLYLKYNRPIPADKMSLNIFNSIAMYGADLIRFKEAYAVVPYIYGIQDVLNKSMPGSKIEKMISNLFERKLQGKSRKFIINNKAGRLVEKVVDTALAANSPITLAFRIPSSVKNFMAGSANVFIQAEMYGLSRKEIFKAMGKNSVHIADLFQSEVEDGRDSEYISKMRYFNVMPDDQLSETGRKVFISKLGKYRKYNPFNFLAFFRTFGEFEMRSAVAEALSEKFLIPLTDKPNGVPLFEAYDFKDGVLVPKESIIDKEGFEKIEQYYRGKLNFINAAIQGAYGALDRGEYSRYTLGRIIGNMKGWVAYQGMRRFKTTRSINPRSGEEFQGFYTTAIQAIKLLYQTNFSLPATKNLMTPQERAEVEGAAIDMLVLAVIMGVSAILNSIRYDDEDEEDMYIVYFFLYNLLLIEDELNSLNPIFSPLSIYHSRFENNVDGQNFAQYYLNRNVLLPFAGATDALKLTMEMVNPFDDVSPFDEYVPRSKSGKISNPKRYPPDPTLKGDTEISARIQKLFGLNASINFFLNPEYLFRKYERYNPKWYVSSLDADLKSEKRSINSIDKQIKSIERQYDYIDDPDTKRNLMDKVSDLQKQREESGERQSSLTDIYSETGRR
jgi:hypothetical protein